MFSRNIEDLTPECRAKYFLFARKMAEAGLRFIVTCTLRQHVEQFTLYAQGRMPLEEVNKLRSWLDWAPLTKWQNNIVTWTLQSAHLPGDDGKANAFDIAIVRGDRRPTWDEKADINDNDVPDYLEAAEIGRSVGLEPGAFWQSQDLCHYQG